MSLDCLSAAVGERGAPVLGDPAGEPNSNQASPRPQPSGELQLEDLLRRSGADGSGGLGGSLADGSLPESQLLALAQRQAERDRELAAAHRRVFFQTEQKAFSEIHQIYGLNNEDSVCYLVFFQNVSWTAQRYII